MYDHRYVAARTQTATCTMCGHPERHVAVAGRDAQGWCPTMPGCPMTDNLPQPINLPEPIEWVEGEIVDSEPTPKPVCWWRCGPCPRHPEKTAGQWGIQAMEDFPTGDLYLRDEKTKYAVKVIAEEWQIHTTPDHQLVSVDVLAFMPPRLPQAVDWQRITYWNDRHHPGDDQDNWRFDFDGPEAFE